MEEFYDAPIKKRRVLHTHHVNHSEPIKDPNILSQNEANTSYCPADIVNAEVLVERNDIFNDVKEILKESQSVMKDSNLTTKKDNSVELSTELKMDAVDCLMELDLVNHTESNKDPNLLSPSEANTSYCSADIVNAEVLVDRDDTFNGVKEILKESQSVMKDSNLTTNKDNSIEMSTELKMDAVDCSMELDLVNHSESNKDPNLLSPSKSNTSYCPADIVNAEVLVKQGDTFNGQKEILKEESQSVMKDSNLTANKDNLVEMSTESKMNAVDCLMELDAIKGSSSANEVRNEENPPPQILGACCETSDSHSRKKLLVLDVNGLLVDIVADPDEAYKPDTIIGSKAVFKRPYCDEFLKFCFERFNVGVWTSRTRRNIERVLDFLIKDTLHQLLFCWDQSHCTETGFNTIENSKKPLVLKELKRLWEKQDPQLPWDKGVYDEKNTFLLDDSPYKALRNPPYTAIFPFSYSYRNTQDKELGPEGNLRNYLERLAASDNVQKFIEQNPFGQQPITYNSESWKFYVKVIGGTSSEAVADANAALAVKLLLKEKSQKGPTPSRKKLIIIDASGLLVDMATFPRHGYKADAVHGSKAVFKRPYCDEFLQFCFEKFNVGVWTSTTRRNIDRVLDFLMRDIPHKLLFCWDNSYCTDTGFYTVENIQKPLVLKELRRLWEKQDPNLPWRRGEYDASNTLLIEYSPYKALLNPPYTAIFPYPYRYWNTEDNFLGPDGDLRVYLEKLAASENVQKFVEQNPFGQRPITKKNLSWGFYQKVIRSLSSEPESDVNSSVTTQCNMSERKAETTDASVTHTLSELKADADNAINSIAPMVPELEPEPEPEVDAPSNGSLDALCDNSSDSEARTATVALSELKSDSTAMVVQSISKPDTNNTTGLVTLLETETNHITVSTPITILEPNGPQNQSDSEADTTTASVAVISSEPKPEPNPNTSSAAQTGLNASLANSNPSLEPVTRDSLGK